MEMRSITTVASILAAVITVFFKFAVWETKFFLIFLLSAPYRGNMVLLLSGSRFSSMEALSIRYKEYVRSLQYCELLISSVRYEAWYCYFPYTLVKRSTAQSGVSSPVGCGVSS